MSYYSFEEDIIRNIKNNTIWIVENNYRGSQTLAASKLDIRVNTLNTYIKGNTKPSIAFIYKICKENNISINDFFTINLRENKREGVKKQQIEGVYNKFVGKYYTYFFVVDSNSLKEGLIQEGVININYKGETDFEILNTNKRFIGHFTFSNELLFLNLKDNKEKVSITMKSPSKTIKEKYISGVGIINISSPEDNRVPSSQKIILSRVRIPIDKYFNTLKEFLSLGLEIKIKKKFLREIFIKHINIEKHRINELNTLIEHRRISDEDKICLGYKEIKFIQELLTKEEFIIVQSHILSSENIKDVVFINSIKANVEDNRMIYKFIKNEFKDKVKFK
ncbi:helix-turn-helix domain-containing protein [Clostridium hydrogeniformans]|uniref:helix-turn-helix domain-containing protein n=1 Tax=Clostridium hydrogeniformans TaxID=349933 RepID=UPI00048936B4|nr:helix-turn-helix transcriptional regulator [Clostridium hydrogeniformans]